LKDCGFDAVDLNVEEHGKGVLPNVYEMPHDEFVAYFKDIKDYADEIGIEIRQTHSLCVACKEDEEFNQKAFEKGIKHLEATSLLGCKYCVIHSANTTHFRSDITEEEMHEINQALYNRFIPYAEKLGVCITLESFGAARIDGKRGKSNGGRVCGGEKRPVLLRRNFERRRRLSKVAMPRRYFVPEKARFLDARLVSRRRFDGRREVCSVGV
jgi:hypothetical protein